MLASAVRSYLNRFAVALGKMAVVVTNNDSAYSTAFDLARHGVVVTVADHRDTIDRDLGAKARALGIEQICRHDGDRCARRQEPSTA